MINHRAEYTDTMENSDGIGYIVWGWTYYYYYTTTIIVIIISATLLDDLLDDDDDDDDVLGREIQFNQSYRHDYQS